MTKDQHILANEVAHQQEMELFRLVSSAVQAGIYHAFKGKDDG